MSERKDSEVYEPEVLPPAEKKEKRKSSGHRGSETVDWGRWKKTFGPIVLGMFVDALDFLTIIPHMGFIIGAVAAYTICSMYNLRFKYRLMVGLAAGLYCCMPATNRLPLGTILGFLVRCRQGF